MNKWIDTFLMVAFLNLAFIISAYGDDSNKNITRKVTPGRTSFKPQPYSSNRDLAFISIWGSRPDAKKLQGFQRAVLFNAQGEVVTKIDMRSDSIYSLDKMIQQNKTKGPLVVKMYR